MSSDEKPKKKRRVYKSGCEKRKQAQHKSFSALAPRCAKITSFFPDTVPPKSANANLVILPVPLEVESQNNESVEKKTGHPKHSQESQPSTSTIQVENIISNKLSPKHICDSDSEDTSEHTESETEALDDISIPNIRMEDDLSEINIFVSPPTHASIQEKLLFLKNHPIQPTHVEFPRLPFKTLIYKRQLTNGEYVPRNWLSYSSQLNKLFCTICMVFSNIKSVFNSDGMGDFKRVKQRIREHENSLSHSNSVDAYFRAKNNENIEFKINSDFENLRKNQVTTNRMVIKRIIDIILFIARQNLSYRGKDESFSLLRENDLSLKRGNFLELCVFLSKYDEIMKSHIHNLPARSIKKSSRGRGALVTFLSKTTVNQIISILGNYVKHKIAEQVQQAKNFSIQVDSTQDISVREQLAIILRYVHNGEVFERLISLISVEKTSGLALFNTLKIELEKVNLDVSNIIGCSFDGAANMSGQYNGLQAQIKANAPGSVYTWCYAHVLNLVVSDGTENIVKCKTFFGLLNRTACFMTESYKRHSVWKGKLNEGKFKSLKKISNTRWWSKAKALETLFGSSSDQSNELYTTLLVVLHFIATSNNFDAKTSSEAQSLIGSWVGFETLNIAFLYLKIFEILTPASNYLQTKGLDFNQAFHIIEKSNKDINKMYDTYYKINENVKNFITFVENKNCLENTDIFLETDFPVIRQRRKKLMLGEECRDEVHILNEKGATKKFEIEVYKVVVNQIRQSLTNRFSDHEVLYKEFFYFDPRNFKLINNENIKDISFLSISNLTGISPCIIKNELISFSQNFQSLKKQSTVDSSIATGPIVTDVEASSNSENDSSSSECSSFENFAIHFNKHQSCSGCLICCFKLIHRYNLHALTYSNLYIVYKCLITLSCTQVSCERVFSKLKIILTRLRSLLGQEYLEAFMLLSVETDILVDLNYDVIIDTLAKKSPLLKGKLLN